MKPFDILIALLLALAAWNTAAAQSPADQADDPRAFHVVTAEEIAERARRVLNMDPDTALIWHSGMVNADNWLVQLELALMEAAGPEDVRKPDDGVKRLRDLLEQGRRQGRLSSGAELTLEVVITLINDKAVLGAKRDMLRQRLEEERQAHLETLEKLAALRDIEQQLDQRETDNGGEP